MKKLLFYILFFIGLAGCGQKGTNLPDKIKVYQIYEYDNSYGMEEQLPFGGLRGEVKQIVKHIGNGGTETYTFHRNGLIDEISTDVFDAESKQNKIDKIKYNYKYKDDILYRTIQKNGSKIHEDKTYYRNGLPMLRESNAGTEKWNFDNEGRLTSYSRNGDVLLEKKYMLNSAYEGQWIEEHYYQGYGVDGEYYIEIINYNNANQITHIEHYNGNSKELSYKTEYTYRMDGSYYDDFCSFDKYGNLEGNRYEANEYEYDINGNWIKKISTIWHTDKHSEEIREIIYWDGFLLEEEIIPVTSSDADDEADDMVVVEEEIIPIVNAEPVENEDISEDEAIS